MPNKRTDSAASADADPQDGVKPFEVKALRKLPQTLTGGAYIGPGDTGTIHATKEQHARLKRNKHIE